jgi:hypothetical protein
MPIRCPTCNAEVGGSTVPVHVKPFTRSGTEHLQPGELGAWCTSCARMTVYVPDRPR